MYNQKYHDQDLSRYQFLVTGGAGFIGSNIVEYLLKYNAKKVRVLDDFSTGYRRNIEPFLQNPAFELIEGDIRNLATCKSAAQDIDFISHQAALGSVPRSIDDPITNNEVNISGFLNMLCAVKDSQTVKRFVYAASSSTYGDDLEMPKIESRIGNPLSPYAVTKYVNELYANVFAKNYGTKSVGLRYFNVFGPRQSPEGAYAAVIPLFIDAVKQGRPAIMHGDGEQTRDFTFVENVVQANLKAFFVDNEHALNEVYNVACGEKISLNQLLELINEATGKNIRGTYEAARKGDIKNSWADISKAVRLLGYHPAVNVREGISITVA